MYGLLVISLDDPNFYLQIRNYLVRMDKGEVRIT